MEIKGTCEDNFLEVKELFKSLHESNREVGSSFSVYKDGLPLVDIWGGYKNLDELFCLIIFDIIDFILGLL